MPDETNAPQGQGGHVWPDTLSRDVMDRAATEKAGRIYDETPGETVFRFNEGGPIYGYPDGARLEGNAVAYPDALTLGEMEEAIDKGLGKLWEHSADEPRVFRYNSGGPVYSYASGQKVEIDEDEDPGDAGDDDPETDEDETGDDAETEAAKAAEPEQGEGAGADADASDSPEQDEYEETTHLDALTIPAQITAEDLKAAALDDGPGFTHGEALLAAVSAATAVSPEFDMKDDPDVAEALYEFGVAQNWPTAEAFFRQLYALLELGHAGPWEECDADIALWLEVFRAVGDTLSKRAGQALTDYSAELSKLALELDRQAQQRKLAARRKDREKRKKARPAKIKRAARAWAKLKAKQEKDAAEARKAKG